MKNFFEALIRKQIRESHCFFCFTDTAALKLMVLLITSFVWSFLRSFGLNHVGMNYGLVFTSQAITAPVGVLLSSTLSDIIGWFGMFIMTAAFSFSGK